MSEMERAREEEEEQDGLAAFELLSPRSRHQTLGSGIVQRRGRMATEPLQQQRLFINQTAEATSPAGLWPAVDGLGSLSRNRTASNLDVGLQSPEGLAKSASLQSIRFIDEERIEAHRRQHDKEQAKESSSIKGLTLSALNSKHLPVLFHHCHHLCSRVVLVHRLLWIAWDPGQWNRAHLPHHMY
jgi:hypothetical protein